MARPSSRDTLYALNLPDQFFHDRSRPAFDRVASVVRRHWSAFPAPAQAHLAQTLLPILEPLDSPERVSEETRTKCKHAVLSWLKEQ